MVLDVSNEAINIVNNNENPVYVRKNSIVGDVCGIQLQDENVKDDTSHLQRPKIFSHKEANKSYTD